MFLSTAKMRKLGIVDPEEDLEIVHLPNGVSNQKELRVQKMETRGVADALPKSYKENSKKEEE